ncbi:hypothetical protein K439DRAFT_1615638 [Ramaria rubella]|nr:hypothetical protein K439DRAFT_1615638 [Ramaria rubella]
MSDTVPLDGRLAAFLTLQILGGHVGMTLMLLTSSLSHRIIRHPIFINFCATWMLYSLSYTLLFYAGQTTNQHPSFLLCATQSAMVYGAPAMISISVLVFVLHLYLVLRQNVYKDSDIRWPRLRFVTMLAAPYLIFMLVFVIAIVWASNHPQQVHRSSFYCTLGGEAITNIAAGISVVAIAVSLVIEVLTAMTLRLRWRVFRDTEGGSGLSISLLARTLVVLICSVIALFACMAFLANIGRVVPNMIIACLPLIAFLLFGTQTDFVRVWCFWRKHRQDERLVEPQPVWPPLPPAKLL